MSKSLLKFVLVGLIITLFTSCGGGLNGTYVPKNDAAKQSMYSKFIFKGGRVKVIMGAMGIEMPGGYEYSFKRKGDKVFIGISGSGIELNYNKETDELYLLFGGDVGAALNEYAPVWGKEGSFDPNNPEPEEQTENRYTGQSTPKASKSILGKIKEYILCKILKKCPPDSISLNKTFLELENTGASEQVIATILPADIPTKNKKVTWQSNDTTVAIVDENGVVTAVASGSTLISAFTVNGLPATCSVEVTVPVDSVLLNINNKTLSIGDTLQLTAIVLPDDATDKTVIWESDSTAVADVDENGVVTAKGAGLAVISASTVNGLSATCSVQVEIENKDEGKKTIPPPPPAQLNALLNRIKNSDDKARDEIRKILGNSLRVEGAANISNVQQLITDVSNGGRYRVTKVNTGANGKIVSISVSK